tara:strand:- start:69 stop:752 length:684 start_codon:yes stop_codon:yes gene_type:complete
MPTELPSIDIKAKANHHAWFLFLLGSLLLLITLITSNFFWQEYRFILIFTFLLAIVIIFTALLKHFEPKISFHLTPEKITYHHRHGCWQLTWCQIQSINNISEIQGLERLELPYLGIRLDNIALLAEQISPRLANRLIHEQRPLMTFAVMNQLLSLEQVQLNFEPYVLPSGLMIKGPIAAFLHHTETLKTAYGYHLYIPDTAVDRELSDFILLLKRCKLASVNYNDC